MKTVYNDLLGMLICSGVLYAVYAALLERRIPLRWCRRYLLAAVVAAFILPLLRIPVWPGPTVVLTGAPAVAVGSLEAAAEFGIPDEPAGVWPMLFGALYAIGAAIVLFPTLRQLRQLHNCRKGAQIARHADYTLVRTAVPIAACSFFRTIYISQSTPDAELAVILAHEVSHVRHRHSAERVVAEVLKAALWWNPFVWLLAERLREAEEFEADSDVLRSGCDRQFYMQLILKQLIGYRPDITNGLRNSFTKKRFLMMTTNHAHRYALLRLAGTVPAVVGLLCVFSFTTRAAVYVEPASEPETPAAALAAAPLHASEAAAEAQAVSEASAAQPPVRPSETTTPDELQIKSDDETWLRAEQMPRYREGDLNDFRAWVQQQLQYPAAAYTQQLEGRVVVSFVIEKDGTLDEIQVLQSPSALLSEAAVQTLQRSERWTPGQNEGKPVRVRYVLPVDFALDPAPTAAETAAPEQRPAAGSEEVHLRTEQMPRYQGGDLQTFRTWVAARLRYPQAAREAQTEGRVVVSFVVERDGSIQEITVLSTPSEVLSEEVLRVLRQVERWEPGRNAAGETVRVKFTMPFDFQTLSKQDGSSNPLTEAPEEAATTPQTVEVRIDPMVVLTFREE